ncbi:MAG: FlgD immunoglobulin-like domain containing protein [Candidatus Krumholzibacteriia bacterium]
MRPAFLAPSLVLSLVLLQPGAALADTFVFPHVLETSGSLSQTAGSLETVIDLVWGRDDDCDGPDPADEALLWIYDEFGSPLANDVGGPVCFPCSWPSDPAQPTRISMVELMVAAGMSPGLSLSAFAVLETGAGGLNPVRGGGAAYVFTPSGGELAGSVPPEPIAPSSPPEACRTFVFPHILETRDLSASGGPTFDTTIFITYLSGLQGGSGDPATNTAVDLYLFDQTTGAPLSNAVGETICAPCTFPMGGSGKDINPHKREIDIETVIVGGGGSIGDMENITAVAVASGNAQDVHMTSMTEKSRTGPGDLAVFVFEPQEISAATQLSAVQDIPRRYADLRNHPNPFNPTTTLSYTLPRAGDATLRVTDVRGRVVRTLEVGSQSEGDHEVMWDGRDDSGRPLPSGTYLARLETADFATVQKMALLK